MWHWILFTTKENKAYLDGPFNDDTKAVSKAEEWVDKKGGVYELFQLNTRDDAKAARMVKSKRRELVRFGRTEGCSDC